MLGKFGVGKKSRLLAVIAVSLTASCVFAVYTTLPVIAVGQANSTDYSVDEAYFGTGGDLGDCTGGGGMGAYCARTSVGDLVVGPAADATNGGNQTQGGQNTDREEFMEIKINDSSCPHPGFTSYDLGYLSPSSTKYVTGNFSVRVYNADKGYNVYNGGDPPKNTGANVHTFATMSFASSTTGTEQFGLNLVANSGPIGGFNRDQILTGGITGDSVGEPAANYNTADKYTYNKGDIIAGATKSSGTTCYYPTYVYNISTLTAAGTYTFNHDLVVTGTY